VKRLLALLLVWSACLLLGPPASRAEDSEVYGGVSLAAAQGGKSVEMLSQTVDAYISEQGGRATAWVKCTFKLHNPSRLEWAALTVGFPTWGGGNFHFHPARFTSFTVLAGKERPVLRVERFQTRIGQEARAVDWYVWDMSLAPDEKRVVEASYSYDLGENSILHFSFGLVGMGWQGKIGSLRVTVHLPNLSGPGQALRAEPPYTDFDGEGITWLFVGFEPPKRLNLAFIKPSLWQRLSAAREGVAQGRESAQAHHALGVLYKNLWEASIGQVQLGPAAFYAQAVGELERAKQLDPALGEARLELAALYWARAQGSGEATFPYAALAVEEMEEVLKLNPADVKLKARLRDAHLHLAEGYRAKNLLAQAAEHFQRALSLEGGRDASQQAMLESKARESHLAWARELISQGRLEEALRVAGQAPGEGVLAPYEDLRPWFRSLRAEVHTSPQERAITIYVHLHPLAPPQAAEVLKLAPGTIFGPTPEGKYQLQFTLPFTSSAQLLAEMKGLEETLPRREELEPWRALLAPNYLIIDWKAQFFREELRYQELVDLERAGEGPKEKLIRLEAALAELERASSSREDVGQQLRLAILAEYRAAWQGYLVESGVAYLFASQSKGQPNQAQSWSLTLGQERELKLETVSYRPPALALALGGGLMLVGLAIWWLARVRAP